MRVHVEYPLLPGDRLTVRAEPDWERDVEPLPAPGPAHDFDLGDELPFRYWKPLLHRGGATMWARGPNRLAFVGGAATTTYPYFGAEAACHVCTLQHVPSAFEQHVDVRVFLPPGYDENTAGRYPVLYMQDGHNLFFPSEAFAGATWHIPSTLATLESMNLVREVIVVGIVPKDRLTQYTAPGYESYARFFAEELKPWVDGNYRTRPDAADTAVLGSSLGGVVSLHIALSYPELFGQVGCMSSTFGYRDDLRQRVQQPLPLRIYLDSGWPQDNYEATRAMHQALVNGGTEPSQLLYIAWPEARHQEQSWAIRAHVPFQFFFRE